MAKKTASLLPATAELLQMFGERLRLARKRRRMTARAVAERAGMAPMTLRSLERGGSGVTIGAYLAVMQVLGIEHDIGQLAAADPVGRELQDAQLSTPRKRRINPVAAEGGKSHPPRDAATTRLQRPARDRGAAQAPQKRDALPDENLHEAQVTPAAAQVGGAQKAARVVSLRSAVDPALPEQLLLFADPVAEEKELAASQPRAEITRAEGGDPGDPISPLDLR